MSALRHARQMRGWSQQRLADMLGTSDKVVSRWELGLAHPSPYFQERLCHLFAQDASALGLLDHEVAFPPLHSPFPLVDPLLPPPLRGMHQVLGRDALLAAIQTHLTGDAHHPVVALFGLPGIGKTALALTLAHQPLLRQTFPDGVFWAALGPDATALATLQRWGSLMGLTAQEREPPTVAYWQERLHSVCSQRRMLFILDDVWATDVGQACLIDNSASAVVLTTRFPSVAADLAADGVFPIPPLPAQISQHLVQRWFPGPHTLHQQALLRDLLAQVDGHPLALTLLGRTLQRAALHRQERRITATLERLQTPEARLTVAETVLGAEGTSPRSVMHTLARTIDTLPTAHRATYLRWSAFAANPHTFSETTALTIGDCTPDIVDSLLDLGIIESQGTDRYTMHQVLVDYARVVFRDDPLVLQGQERLIAWTRAYLHALTSVQHHRYQALTVDEVAALDREEAHVQRAYALAVARAQWDAAVEIALMLQSYLYQQGRFAMALDLLQQAQAQLDHLDRPPAEQQLLRGEIWLRRGRIFLLQGQVEDAERAFREGEALADGAFMVALLQFGRGSVAWARDQYDQAEVVWMQVWSLIDRVPPPYQAFLTALVRQGLGSVALRQGQMQHAKDHLQQALAAATAERNAVLQCSLLSSLGVIAGITGAYSEASAYFAQGLALARQLQTRQFMITLLANQGMLARLQGQWLDAQMAYEAGIHLARECGMPKLLLELSANLGDVHLQQGHLAEAEAIAQEGGDLARAQHDRYNEAVHLGLLGQVYERHGQREAAACAYQQAITLARAIGHTLVLYSLLAEWGRFLLSSPQLTEARTVYEEILALAEKTQSKEWRAVALFGRAQVAWGVGEWEAAERASQESLWLFRELGHEQAAVVGTWRERFTSH